MPKCRICKEPFVKIRPLQPTCNEYECKVAYATNVATKAIEREKKKQSKLWAEEKKQIREKIKTLSDYLKDLQTEVNTIVRLIDNGCGCICTGSKEGKKNAGHYRSVQSHPALRFHLDNIHLQSEYSNTYLSGDIIRYQKGLRAIYGIKYLEYVDSLTLLPPIKLSKDEVKEKIIIARQIIKELKAINGTYNTLERMNLRKEYNERLGIYITKK